MGKVIEWTKSRSFCKEEVVPRNVETVEVVTTVLYTPNHPDKIPRRLGFPEAETGKRPGKPSEGSRANESEGRILKVTYRPNFDQLI